MGMKQKGTVADCAVEPIKDYCKGVADKDLWIVSAAVDFASSLQRSNEPLDVCAIRFSKFIDFLIDDFTSNRDNSLAVKFQDGDFIQTKAA